MIRRLEFIADSTGLRLDKCVAQRCQLSRSSAQRLITGGKVTVEGQPTRASQIVSPGQRVVVSLPPPPTTTLAPEDIPLKVVYEDRDLLVVDKPAGLVVHPAPGHPGGTLANAILARCPELTLTEGGLRPGIVHRLDKNTSGLMVVAKSDAARANLQAQLKGRSVVKGYLALIIGHLSPERGAIEAPVGRHPRDRKRMAVVEGGREARTRYRVVSYLDGYTLVEALPETGRTHQIRVHFSAIGHPVYGDPVYGQRSPVLGRQFLHAHRLGFRLPQSGQFKEFTSDLPPELAGALKLVSGAGEWGGAQ